jgi:hypothetical protein
MINTRPGMSTGRIWHSLNIASTCRTETGGCDGLANLDDLSCHAAVPQDGARVANAQDGKHDDACMTITPNLNRTSQDICQSLLLCLTPLAAKRLYAVMAIADIDLNTACTLWVVQTIYHSKAGMYAPMLPGC